MQFLRSPMIISTKRIIMLVLCASLLLNGWLYYLLSQDSYLEIPLEDQQFPLLYPPLSGLSRKEFLEIQHDYIDSYQDLKRAINSSVQLAPGQRYAVYFHNLNTGNWVGINERETFYSGSLRKIPLLVAVIRQAEEDKLFLDTIITIQPEDINTNSGPLGLQGPGKTYTVRELINYTTFYSDNTAANALLRTIGNANVVDTMLNMGLSLQTFIQNNNERGAELYPISAKEYSSSFRSLYYSDVLRRKDSQSILSLLTATNFRSGLPAGVPKNIQVAHKVAWSQETNQHHDCGIVYYPKRPYILCVMTQGMSSEEANQLISDISRLTFGYVDGIDR